MHCPTCAEPLVAVRAGRIVGYACPRCGGRMARRDALRARLTPGELGALWREATPLPPAARRDCPVCRQRMELLGLGPRGEVELDTCGRCRVLWADRGELEALSTSAATPAPPPRHLGQARASRWPDRWWKFLLAAFGVPVETDTGRLERVPWVTWTTVLLMVAVTVQTLAAEPRLVAAWGLVPAEPLRHLGLTWATSFFLHGDLFHLAANAYFLLAFGDNVEAHLGHRRMLLLLVAAALVGDLAHVLLDPRSTLPLIGASGGISGVVVLYALLFPRARLTVFLLAVLPLTLPAVAMLGLWFALQLVGAAQQLAGVSAVSALAHLGGAAVGAVAWRLLR